MSVKHGLLSLLVERPMHGYQLRTEFEAATGATWPLNIGQVYTTLARLERDGLVAAVDDDSDETRRLYQVTEAGRDECLAWFNRPVSAAPARDELAIKLALAVRLPSADIEQVVQVQRKSTLTALQDYTRSREQAGDDLAWRLVADSLIFHAEAEIRWLDHCEASLIRRQREQTKSARPAASDVSNQVVATGAKQ
jgi:DNA-binding PadR family transcriptional regulator